MNTLIKTLAIAALLTAAPAFAHHENFVVGCNDEAAFAAYLQAEHGGDNDEAAIREKIGLTCILIPHGLRFDVLQDEVQDAPDFAVKVAVYPGAAWNPPVEFYIAGEVVHAATKRGDYWYL